MKILFLQKQSLIEYPGKISAVIFLGGCNLRCQFCYLPDLVLEEKIKKAREISQKEILAFLEERKNFLEAVAITGGEPTLFGELPSFLQKIKKMGYLIEIETNGTNFLMLKKLIEDNLVDYVALDIKHRFVFEKWYEITGRRLTKKMFEEIKKSIQYLIRGEKDYEFRTTLVKEFHTKEDIIEICKEIKGAKVYYLQNFEEKNYTLSGKKFTPFLEEEIKEIIEEGKKYTNIKPRPYLFS